MAEERSEPATEKAQPKQFGTLAGVFTPTLLTILGVILFLREGWVVGNAGLGGAIVIILLAFAITGCTALSMSSVATNIRIGAGGAYAIIARSLGLEVGGSVGIPLYVSQALAVTMYIFGFREGWLWLFPNHPALVVDLSVFAVLFALAYLSASLAVRVQFVIIAILVAALISIAVAAFQGSMQHDVTWWGSYPGAPGEGGTGFWMVFAVFFPAATGIMAGANMSGDLRDPRRSIPVGTLSAIGLSLLIYLAVAYWLASSATPKELVGNYTVMIEKAAWGPAVLAGLMGATFSSALASIVGAPRVLQALGAHGILPLGKWFARRSRRGEPRNAMLVTGAIVLGALFLRDLNAVAPLITMFFLVTYATINVVVLIEQSLGLLSFRPLLRIPRVIPLFGTAGCLFAMFIVSPTMSLVAVAVVIVVYGILLKRKLEAPFGDVRSGLFVAVAEWAAKNVTQMHGASGQRAWKPNLLVPVEEPGDLRGNFRFIRSIAYPKGSVNIVGLTTRHDRDQLGPRLESLSLAFREDGVFSSFAIVDSERFGPTLLAGMQSLEGAFFRPNIVFLELRAGSERDLVLADIAERAQDYHLGVLLYAEHPRARLGRRQSLNVWLPRPPEGWEPVRGLRSSHLALLASLKLKRNWDAEARVILLIEDEAETVAARAYLEQVVELVRLPDVDLEVLVGDREKLPSQGPMADLNVFSISGPLDCNSLRARVDQTRSSCLFAMDSGDESALV